MDLLSGDDHVIVVGAGLAGWRFVEALRRDGYEGALTLIGNEVHLPYDRPPLSKQVLSGKWEPDQTALATDELVSSLEVTTHLGVAAQQLDVATTTVRLDNGTSVAGTRVVLATGTRARQLPLSAASSLHTLRSRDDVVRLTNRLNTLAEGDPVVVIGGGFIGAEAATALAARGLRPIILEAAERPLLNVVGPSVSTWLEGLAPAARIELRTSQQITDVLANDNGFVVHFESGDTLVAPLVVLSVGASANLEWLATSGLTIDNGVVVNTDLVANESNGAIGAIGDVACFEWQSVVGTELVRIEHWQTANDHAAHLAKFWTTGEQSTSLMIPYFWSDQYGKKIQMLGHPRPSDDVTLVNGSLDDAKWTALFSRDGVVNGVIALSQPRALMLSRPLLEHVTTLKSALELAPWGN